MNFDGNGVELYEYETNGLFIQVSELNKVDEFALNHIPDPQIRTELKEVTSAYKPEKTETINVSMKIDLTDDTLMTHSTDVDNNWIKMYVTTNELFFQLKVAITMSFL